MRRLMAVAAFAVLLALPLWAQRGARASGGHGGVHAGSVGSRGGFQGRSGFQGRAGFGASMGGRHFSGGMPRRGFSGGSFRHNNFHHPRFRTFGFRNNCVGFGCRGRFAYPWWGSPYYDPYWWGDSGSSYDEDYERDRQTANEMNRESLEEQKMLRQEDAAGDQDLYANRSSYSRQTSNRETANREIANEDRQQSSPAPATVLVFRDLHSEEIGNYAIVGQTLWNFAEQRTRKIPVSDLDLTATVRANEERGVTFQPPSVVEGQ